MNDKNEKNNGLDACVLIINAKHIYVEYMPVGVKAAKESCIFIDSALEFNLKDFL